MTNKKKFNIIKKPIKIYVDKEYYKHINLTLYLFKKTKNLKVKIDDYDSSKMPNLYSDYDVLIDFQYNIFEKYDYHISSNSSINFLNDNGLYILSYESFIHLNKEDNIVMVSTINPCSCYIENILNQGLLDILDIIHNENKYCLIIKKQDNQYYEFLLMMLCLFSDLGFNAETIIKYISSYIK